MMLELEPKLQLRPFGFSILHEMYGKMVLLPFCLSNLLETVEKSLLVEVWNRGMDQDTTSLKVTCYFLVSKVKTGFVTFRPEPGLGCGTFGRDQH
jgi:hypothetical protein